MKELPTHCPNCKTDWPWDTGQSRFGRIGHTITIWAETTECKACGYHFMTDEQIDQADEQLTAVENVYSPKSSLRQSAG